MALSWPADQILLQEEKRRLSAGVGELQDQIKFYQGDGAIVEKPASLRRRIGDL